MNKSITLALVFLLTACTTNATTPVSLSAQPVATLLPVPSATSAPAAQPTASTIAGDAFEQMGITLPAPLDAFPDKEIVLPYPPVTLVTSIKYKDSTNVEQTWSATEYQTETDSDLPARIRLAYGYTWPVVYAEMNVVRVRYFAGYASVDAIPEAIKTWMKLRVNSMYAQREAFVAGQTIMSLQRDFVDGLLDPYRIVNV